MKNRGWKFWLGVVTTVITSLAAALAGAYQLH